MHQYGSRAGENVDSPVRLPPRPKEFIWAPHVSIPSAALASSLCQSMSEGGRFTSRASANLICDEILSEYKACNPVNLYRVEKKGAEYYEQPILRCLARSNQEALVRASGLALDQVVGRLLSIKEPPANYEELLPRLADFTGTKSSPYFGGMEFDVCQPEAMAVGAFGPQIQSEFQKILCEMQRTIPEIAQRLAALESEWRFGEQERYSRDELRKIIKRFVVADQGNEDKQAECILFALELGISDLLNSIFIKGPREFGLRVLDDDTLPGWYHVNYFSRKRQRSDDLETNVPSLLRHAIFLNAAIRLSAFELFSPEALLPNDSVPEYLSRMTPDLRQRHISRYFCEIHPNVAYFLHLADVACPLIPGIIEGISILFRT